MTQKFSVLMVDTCEGSRVGMIKKTNLTAIIVTYVSYYNLYP